VPQPKIAFVILFLVGALLLNTAARAEQKQSFGEYDVHYIIVPTMTLKPEIAEKYGLLRARNRSLVNISILNALGQPTSAAVTGISTNLLGQDQTLVFSEVTEGEAIYYLALLRHANEEYHRVAIDIVLANGDLAELRFSQQMYWEE